METKENCPVLYYVRQLSTMIRTHICEQFLNLCVGLCFLCQLRSFLFMCCLLLLCCI